MKKRFGERSAACSVCGKTFTRSDTLLRHRKSHHATDDRGPVHRMTNGTFRACSACAAARSRCSGDMPCGRCSVRNLDCVYPNKKRKQEVSFPITSTKLDDTASWTGQISGRSGFDLRTDCQYQDHDPGSQDQRPEQHLPTPPPSWNNQVAFNVSFSPVQLEGKAAENNHVTLQLPPSPPGRHDSFNTIPDQYQHDFGDFGLSYELNTFEDSMNWIPVSVFPSPYESELEHEFSYLMPPAIFPTSTNNLTDYGTAVAVDPAHQLYPVSTATSRHREEDLNPLSLSFTLIGFEHSSISLSSSDQVSVNTSHTGPMTHPDIKKIHRKLSPGPDFFATPPTQKTGYAFPPVSESDSMSSAAPRQTHYCSKSNYEIVAETFRKLCVDTTDLSAPFETSSFPDINTFNSCVELYFDHFHPILPLIHRPSFGNNSPWIVILATAAIGSTFVRESYGPNLRDSFQELLRRAINQSSDGSTDHHLDLGLAQARILNLIGLTQSEREQLRLLAPRYHSDVARWCLESGVLQLPEGFVPADHDIPCNNNPSRQWDLWKATESLRRVGYICWLLDTSLGYLANTRPLCNMDDARTPLPCSEALWSAETLEDWQTKSQNVIKTPSLCGALENLYAKKALHPDLSELSQTLLINALFQRTWEVGTHIKQPLSEWVPTGKARGFLNTPLKDRLWLPLYPLYTNWRNSACDCLDVIHWQASATVASAAGVEHDLILHLHLARIILLTPFQEIQDLILSLIGRVGEGTKASFYVHDGSYQPRSQAKLPQIRKITWRWLREDQHKARLAMVHAGSVFWHIRRYSSASFYEPLAVYLASIVLWTYASYKSSALERDPYVANAKPVAGRTGLDSDLSTSQPTRVERNLNYGDDFREASFDSQSESVSDQPEFINLDRPCDNEIVQHFVRNGHNMSGHMTNVGDICKTPSKVLLEGAKLLRTRLSCWGVSREYFDNLTKLAELQKVSEK